MEEHFNEEQARDHLHRLGHDVGDTFEIRVIGSKGQRARVGFYNDITAACRDASSWSCKRNVYVGINPRSEKLLPRAPNRLEAGCPGGKICDITKVRNFMIDLDPETPRRRLAASRSKVGAASSTKEELEATIEVAQGIIRDEEFLSYTLVQSGNGVHILVPVDLEAGFESAPRLTAFEDEIRKKYAIQLGNHNIKLDHVSDLTRIETLAGTQKIKGPSTRRRPHRSARIIDQSPQRVVDPALCERIMTMEPPRNVQRRKYTGRVELRVSKTLTPLPVLCPTWNEIYLKVPATPSGQRHRIVFFLVAAMVDGEMAHQAILDAIHIRDKHFDGKFWSRGSYENDISNMIEKVQGIPLGRLCNLARHYLGKEDLCAPCPERYRGRTRQKRFEWREESESDEQPSQFSPETICLEDARDCVDVAIGSVVKAANHKRAGDEAIVIGGQPGLGKSTTVSKVLTRQSQHPGDLPFQFNIYVDRTSRIGEIQQSFEQLPGGEQILRNATGIRGKSSRSGFKGETNIAPPCKQSRQVELLRGQGYAPREYSMVCSSCRAEWQKQCDYFRQFDPDKSWLLSIDYIFTKSGGRMNQSDVLICDEGFLRHIFNSGLVLSSHDISELSRSLHLTRLEHPILYDLLEQIKTIIDESIDDEPRTFRLVLAEKVRDLQGICRALRDDESIKHALESIEKEFDVAILPKYFLPNLLRIIEEEEAVNATNSRLTVKVDKKHGPSLSIREPRVPHVGQTPMLILDATADVDLYSRLLGRDVKLCKPSVEVEARVIQVVSGAYPKSSLSSCSSKRRNTHTRRRIAKTVAAIVKSKPGARFAAITHKDFEPSLKNELGPDAITGHYFAIRGTNAMADCTDLILVGTPTINLGEIERTAASMYWRDPPLDYTMVEHLDPIDYRREDGAELYVRVSHYADPRLDQLLWQAREAEMIQAAYRIRPLDKPEEKTIWLLTNLPTPTLPPSEVYESLGDLCRHLLGEEPRISATDRVIDELVRDDRLNRHLTNREIADELGVGLRTVERAKSKLRSQR